jgi:hypothetical protein
MRKNKIIIVLAIIALTLSFTAPIAFADEDGEGNHLAYGKTGKPAASNGLNNEKSKVKHLYLFEKDSEWNILDRGAWGKVTILTHKDKYIFNGHKVNTLLDYSLINYAPGTDWGEEPYPNPWPGEGSVEIGSGEPTEGGNIHLKGEWSSLIEGKIWLVDGIDFDGDKMVGWNPSEYLFEYDILPPLPTQ